MKLLLHARIRGYDGQSRHSALRHTVRVCLGLHGSECPSRAPSLTLPILWGGMGGGNEPSWTMRVSDPSLSSPDE